MTKVKEQGRNFRRSVPDKSISVSLERECYIWVLIFLALPTWSRPYTPEGTEVQRGEREFTNPKITYKLIYSAFLFGKTLGRPFVVNFKRHLYRLFPPITYCRIFYEWPWPLILCNIKDEKDYWFRIKEVQHNISHL